VHHVFISYSRRDSNWVLRLTERLQAKGRSVWLDQQDIPISLPWFREIGDGIAAADLFLICDSPNSRRSANCGAETEIAFDLGKRALEVEVGSDPAVAADRVTQALAAVTPTDRVRTELAVEARDWDNGGREARALLSARARSRMLRSISAIPPLDATERDFIAASRRRSRRLAVISAVFVLTLVIGFAVAALLNAVYHHADDLNALQAAGYARARSELDQVGIDPYRSLSEASGLGGEESGVNAEVIEAAFETAVPDDAFRVPKNATGFVPEVVGRRVAVATADGERWARPAAAHGVRAARRIGGTTATPTGPLSSDGLRLSPYSDVVDVSRRGHLWRRISLTIRPRVLRLSPDGRDLAAGTGDLVEVADLETGAIRSILSGAVGPIRDIAWSPSGARIWALGDGVVASWPTGEGTTLLDEPSERFEALLPGSNRSTTWVASADGRLREVDLEDGRVISTLHVDDGIRSGAGELGGKVAALSGERGLWMVPLDGAPPRLIRLPGCDPGRGAFANPQTLFLPCLGGDLLEISVPRGAIVRRIKVDRSGAYAVRSLPGSRVVLASDQFADLYAVGESGEVSELFRSECGGSIGRIAASPTVVVPVGAGTGLSGCSWRGLLTGDDPMNPSDWTFDAVDDDQSSTLAETGAVSRHGGVFAYGFSDGTIVLHPTKEILPIKVISNVDGEIRDMSVTPANELLVATGSGMLQRIPLCESCLSNREFARVATAEGKLGLLLGTAKRAPQPR
jgi:hypothetical protein